MQRIDKPTIYTAFRDAYPAGCLPYRRKRFIGQSQQNCFGYFTSFRPSSLGDDEASFEFRPKIACPQNRISSESSTRLHTPRAEQQACGGWLFLRGLESQRKDNTPRFQLIHSDDLKCVDIVGRFFKVFFQGFVIGVSFIYCDGSTP
jgi:hypothetical protein